MADNHKTKEPSWDKFMREKLQFIIKGEPIPPFVNQSEHITNLLNPNTQKQPTKSGFVDEIDEILQEINSEYAPSNEFNLDLDKCIILPRNKHGNYEYEDLIVSMHRLGYNKFIENLANYYGFEVYFPEKESNGYKYIGGVEWNNFLLLNSALGNMTLDLRQILDLKNLLTEGIFSKKKIYNGEGKQISKDILSDIYSEIFLKVYFDGNSSQKGEFIDNTYMSNKNGSIIYNSNHKLEKGVLTPQRIGIVEKYLKEPCFIDSENCTSIGLPVKEGRGLYYIPPINNSITCIVADAKYVTIDCSVPRKTKSYALGIRPARVR